MGIYIFKSKHGPLIKVGHVKADNPWKRVAGRGFFSCVCPPSLQGKVYMGDLELCKWYPNLSISEEKHFHSKMKWNNICGEWYDSKYIDQFVEYFNKLDNSKTESKTKDDNMYNVVLVFKVPYKNKNILLESLPTDNFLSDIGGQKTMFEQKETQLSFTELQFIPKNNPINIPVNKGKPWNKMEKIQLIDFVNSNVDKNEIASKLGRTSYAIHCQLRQIIIGDIEDKDLEYAKATYNPEKNVLLSEVWKDIEMNYDIETLI
jgi:hypothetical protein